MSDECSGCNGLCCYDVVVRITGYDAWRIKHAQTLDYAQFVQVDKDEASGVGAFLLGDDYHALFLGKNAQQPRACTFLMHFPDETRRCGIYAERPRVCAVYPMSLRNGTVDLRDDVACKPSNWNLATLTYPYWRRNLLGYMLEWYVYQRAVSHWNDLPKASRSNITDYYNFVERAFSRIDALRTAMSEGEFERLVIHSRDASADDADRERLERYFAEVDSICSAA